MAVCSRCERSDFGWGKLNLEQAWRILKFLYYDHGDWALTGHEVGWHDPGVRIDSTTYSVGGFSVREYEVSKEVYIPQAPSGLGMTRIAWATPVWAWTSNPPVPSVHGTTSLLAYGDPTTTPGRAQRWQLASLRITDCSLRMDDRVDGLACVVGHNFARIYGNPQHPDSLRYLVEPDDFWVSFVVVEGQHPEEVPRARQPDAPVAGILAPPNPIARNGASESPSVMHAVSR